MFFGLIAQLQNGMAIAKMTAARRPYRERYVARGSALMEIRFISTLTAEDENNFAPALLKAIGALLDQFPIAYTIRIETTGAQVYQHTHAAPHELARAEVAESGKASRAAYYLTRLSNANGS
jgi:hypothetical protein